MKIRTILAASILAVSLGATSRADQIIHFTGSTAFRASTVTAIETVMGGAGNFKAAFVGSSLTGANQSILQGNIGGVLTTIKCTWTGSVGGVVTNAKQIDIHSVPAPGWLSESNLPGTNTSVAVSPGSFTLDGEAQGNASDVDMSDSQQSSSGFSSPVLATPTIAGAGDPAVLVPGQCGIIPFDFVANNGCPSTVTNVNSIQVQNLLNGGVYLSTLTGNSADFGGTTSSPTGPVVYMAGRNFDSGTRLSEFAESGFGIFSSPQQVQLTTTGSGGAATVSHVDLYPLDTLYGGTAFELDFGVGNSGYSSGGTLAGLIATPGSLGKGSGGTGGPNPPLFESFFNINGGYIIAYLGRSDAGTAVSTATFAGNTAHKISFNGYSDSDANIQQGTYQGWEYEYMYETVRTTNPLTTAQKTAINSIYNDILKTDFGASGDSIDAMQVSKPIEGGLITHF